MNNRGQPYDTYAGGETMGNKIDRRNFLKKGLATGVGFAVGGAVETAFSQERLTGPAPKPVIAKPMDVVRVGFVGVGGMGSNHVQNLLRIKGAEIRAVCDIVEEKVNRVQTWVQEAGQAKPEGYSRGEYDYKRMCERDDLDLVYISTPWRWHVPMCVEAMKTGKHAAVEVPAANTLDECWQLVEYAEKTGTYCMMMENCYYDGFEMMVLNMVKQGVLGEVVHAKCGYLHDLRAIKFSSEGEGLWRREHSKTRNGDLYPTHGLGPVAQCMDINRGNQFDYLVSMSSKTRGLHDYAVKTFGSDSPQAKEKYALGDVVTTLIKTMKGETIVVTHDTNLPRPYSRDYLIQGTKGIAQKYPVPKIYIEGRSNPHRWDDLEPWKEEYWHPVWRHQEELAKAAGESGVKGGHGGMDFIEDYRLINTLLNGVEPDMDVYDAAAISAVIELSERSIAEKGKPIKFPDFTRGMWKKHRELQVMKV